MPLRCGAVAASFGNSQSERVEEWTVQLRLMEQYRWYKSKAYEAHLPMVAHAWPSRSGAYNRLRRCQTYAGDSSRQRQGVPQ